MWKLFRYTKGLFVSVAVLSAVLPCLVLAQTTSDPARVEERIDQRNAAQPHIKDELKQLQPATDTDGPDAQPSERFVLAAVTFSGNTVFTAAAFTDIYTPLLARQIGIEDVRKVATDVTAFYREKGYFLSRAVVESQGVEYGVLNIRIVEGKITNVSFDAETAEQADLLRPYGEKIADAAMPANVNTVERYLLLMNDLPGIKAQAKVNKVDYEKGVYRLDVAVSKKPVNYSFNVDNRGTRSVGRDQAYVSATANGWMSGRESTRLGIFTIPSSPKELAYVELQQQWALGTEGTAVSLGGSYSKIDAGADEIDNDLHSNSWRASVTVSHPVIRGRAKNLNVYGVLNTSRQKQHDFGVFDYEDRLQVLRGAAEIYYEDDMQGANYANIWLSRGLGLNDVPGDAQRSRSGGRPVFTKLYARTERRQLFTDNWALKVSVAGQVADQRLLSNEEFSLGGYLFGRGYDGGEISGTHGAAGSIELQYGDDLEGRWLSSYQFYGFYDGGVVWETAENSYASEHESLTSAGIGVRSGIGENMSSGIELAMPLTRPAEEVGGDGKKPRLFFYLNANF